MRHLALDYGTKRIGLALSDSGGQFAQPFNVLPNTPDAPRALAELCRTEGVERLVVGLPLNMDGTPSWMTHAAADFGRQLATATALPVVYVDERLSSFEAQDTLKHRKRSGEKLTRLDKNRRLDALAAAHFLREFLEGRLTPVTPPPSAPNP